MEPGLFPTVYLRVLLSQRAARPGERVSLRVEGTDAASLTRGKIVRFEQERQSIWQPAGTVVVSRTPDQPSRWLRPGETVAVTLGYSATTPLYFDVPPIPAGDYRLRLDAIHGRGAAGDLRHRTATLYAFLRVLEPR
jgi:hypothetical protein